MFDIAVVGAGPAAATFVREMEKHGKSILLIDGQAATHPKPCGGLLATDAQKLLAEFDFTLPKSVLVDPQIFSVKTIDLCTRKITYYQRFYLNMDRQKFDRFLLEKISCDVTVVEGRCIKAKRCEEGNFELKVRTKEGDRIFYSKAVVGADGADSIVRKTFFPDKKLYKYTAIQQWFSFSKTQPFYSCIFDPETSESCSWIIHKDDYLIYGGCFEKKNCRESFEKQKKRLGEFLQMDFTNPIKTEACLVNRPKHFGDFVTGKNGVYLIGEAAGFISPSSFEGISFAIKSGMCLADAFKADDEHKISAEYRKNTLIIRARLWLKMRKRWFMYTPFVRKVIMKTGISSIRVNHTD